jgi:hypothetical protein
MDQSRSRVHEINATDNKCNLGGTQQKDALELLLVYLIGRFGPLNSPEIFELVSCFGSHGVVAPSSTIENVISSTLQNLMLEKHEILYVPEFGKWKLNEGNAKISINETSSEKTLPKLTLRNVVNTEELLNIKGVGTEYVYVVYHSESRIESILRNRQNWLVKVGRTNNLQKRVAQLSQSGPNSLVIGIAFKSYDSRGLEKYIHKALHSQKKACDIPGRREWFYSNLEEISRLRLQFERKSFIAA